MAKKTSSELICDYLSSFKMDKFLFKIFYPSSTLHGKNELLGNVSSKIHGWNK